MPLSHEHVGFKIVAKIKIYILTRAELLFNLCYEIPCRRQKSLQNSVVFLGDLKTPKGHLEFNILLGA